MQQGLLHLLHPSLHIPLYALFSNDLSSTGFTMMSKPKAVRTLQEGH